MATKASSGSSSRGSARLMSTGDLDPDQLANQLTPLIKGCVLRPADARFRQAVTLFNAAAPVNVHLVARPVDSQDVAIIVKFCREHCISPSVKGGGFSTAGWATRGDLLIDLSLMNDVTLSSPTAMQRSASAAQNSDLVHLDPKLPSSRRRTAGEAFDTPASSSGHWSARESSDRDSADEPTGKRAAVLRESSAGDLKTSSASSDADLGDSGSSSNRHGSASSSTMGTSDTSLSSASLVAKTHTLAAPPQTSDSATDPETRAIPVSSSDRDDEDPWLRTKADRTASGSEAMSEWARRNSISNLWPHNIPSGPPTGSASGSSTQSASRTSPVERSESLASASSSTVPSGIHLQRYAIVSFGPGASVRCIDSYTHRAGLNGSFGRSLGKGKSPIANDEDLVAGVPYHTPASAYPVGSGSVYTGGLGYLSRAYSLSVDNIVELEMVLADGRIVILNDVTALQSPELADLWWAARGAAPAFGIVTRTLSRAYPIPIIYSANLVFPFNKATSGSLVRHWRDVLKSSSPNELYANLILTAGPDNTSHVVVIQMSYLGSAQHGEAFVSALSSWSGERMLLKDTCEKSFLTQQDSVAHVLKEGPGRRWAIRGDLLHNLSDALIDKTVKLFCGNGTRKVWLFELMGGAIASPSFATASCINPAARQARFSVAALQQWAGEEEDNACVASVDRWMEDVVMPESACGGPLPCFLERAEPASRVQGAFGDANYARLREIKARVDPHDLFRHTFANGLTEGHDLDRDKSFVRTRPGTAQAADTL